MTRRTYKYSFYYISFLTLLLGLVLAARPSLAQATVVGIDLEGVETTTCGELVGLVATLSANSTTEPVVEAVYELNIPRQAQLDFDPSKTSSFLIVNVGGDERVTVLEGTEPGATRLRVRIENFLVDPPLDTIVVFFRIAGDFEGTLRWIGEITRPGLPTLGDDHFIRVDCPTATPPQLTDLRATKAWSLIGDGDGDGQVDAGDVLRYSTRLDVTGTAEGLGYQALPEAHLELVPGTVVVDEGNVIRGNRPGDTSVQVEVGTVVDRRVTILYRVRVTDPLPVNVTEVECQGQASGSNFQAVLTDDPTTQVVGDPTVTPIDRDPDLAVTKVSDVATVRPGKIAVFDLTASNLGAAESGPAELGETVPAHTIFRPQDSSAGWVCPSGMGAGASCTLALGRLAPGETVPRRFAVEVLAAVPPDVDTLVNTVTVGDDGSAGPDLDPGNNRATATVSLLAQPDPAVTKSDQGASVEPGQTISYTVTARNPGERAASGVVLEETVPEHTRFEPAASDPRWLCTGSATAGDLCTLAVGGLAGAGESEAVIFAVTVDSALPAGVTRILNTVTIRDDGTNGADLDPTNNTATETTPLTGAMADLEVTKTPVTAASEARPGGLLVWDVVVANTGNQGASGVVLTEEVPAHTRFAEASSDAAWSCSGQKAGSVCTLEVGTLPAGASETARFAVTIEPRLPPGVESIENCATASGAGEGCHLVAVPEAVPDLRVTKDDGGAVARPGDTVSYAIGFANAGSQGATGVVLEDELPAGTEAVAGGSDERWSCQAQNPGPTLCRLDLGTLRAGESGLAVLAVRIDPSLARTVSLLTNRVTISDDGTNGPDAIPADNEATETTPVEHPPEGEARLEVTLTDLLALDADGNGEASSGDAVGYVARITNVGEVAAEGVSFTVAPDVNTRLLEGSIAASQGEIVGGDAPGDFEVVVDLGALASGAGADVTFEVEVLPDLPPGLSELVVQGTASGGNTPEEPSDDPETPEDDDPTRTPLAPVLTPHVIPTASEVGLLLLAVLLSGASLATLRRRPPARGRSGGAW